MASFEIVQLENHLRVVVIPTPYQKVCSVQFHSLAGAQCENDDEHGMSHFLEHVLFDKTEKYPSSLALSEAIEYSGGYLNGVTSHREVEFYANVLSSEIENAMDVLSQIVLKSTFDDLDVEREKKIITQEIKNIQDDPERFLANEVYSHIFPDSREGRPISGTFESISTFNSQKLHDFYNRNYKSHDSILTVAGDFKLAQIAELAGKYFSSLERDNPKIFNLPKIENKKSIKVLKSSNNQQAKVSMDFPTVNQNSSEKWAVNLLATIIGGGMASRLFQNVREKRGLVYHISASSYFHPTYGIFEVYFGCEENVVLENIKLVLAELEQLSTIEISDRELERAKNSTVASFLFGFQEVSNIAEFYSSRILLNMEPIDHLETIERIKTVTKSDIQLAAKNLLSSGYYITVLANSLDVGNLKL